MKILQVNVVYNYGSTGKIVYDIHTELKKQNIDSVVCYGRGNTVHEENVHKICGEFYSDVNHFLANLSGSLYGGCSLSTDKLISTIKKEKPDIVHLHCLNGYFVNIYSLVEWLRDNHIKTVLTLHAEFMYTGGCGHSIDCEQWKSTNGCGQIKCPRYRSDMHSWLFDRSRSMWKRMKEAFEGFNDGLIVTSVSPWLMERAKSSPILGDKKHIVILNGVDTGVFRPYGKEDAEIIKKELKIGDERVIFHATANFNDDPEHIKGGYYILKLAEHMPNVKFVVAGFTKQGMNIPKNVILLGKVTDKEKLARYYSMADLSLLTSQKETFSMIVAESMCCGTPVAGFKAGAPEMIALPIFSAFSEHGDIDALEKNAVSFLENNFDSESIAKNAFDVYSKEIMVNEYKNLYTALAKGGVQ